MILSCISLNPSWAPNTLRRSTNQPLGCLVSMLAANRLVSSAPAPADSEARLLLYWWNLLFGLNTSANSSSRGNQSSDILVQTKLTSLSQFFRMHLWMSNLQRSIENTRKCMFDIELPPGSNSFICHNLLEANGQTFSEESLAMFTLSIQFPLTKFNTILQKDLQLSARKNRDHPSGRKRMITKLFYLQ